MDLELLFLIQVRIRGWHSSMGAVRQCVSLQIYQIFLCFDLWRVQFFSPKAFITGKRDVALGVHGYGGSWLTEEMKTSPVVRFQGGIPVSRPKQICLPRNKLYCQWFSRVLKAILASRLNNFVLSFFDTQQLCTHFLDFELYKMIC